MKEQDLFRALRGIDTKYILDAAPKERRLPALAFARVSRKVLVPAVAIICCLAMLASFFLLPMLFGKGDYPGANVVPPHADDPSDDAPNSITVRSLDELKKMREMLDCTDQKEFENYLMSVTGGGATSKKELSDFISLVEAVPYIQLIDGDITFISYTLHSEVLFVSIDAPNKDWVRFEYVLSYTDVEEKLKEVQKEMKKDNLLSEPIFNNAQNVKCYVETREPHPTDPGEEINWYTNIDGHYVRIVYYTSSADQVSASEIFSGAKTSHISVK